MAAQDSWSQFRRDVGALREQVKRKAPTAKVVLDSFGKPSTVSDALKGEGKIRWDGVIRKVVEGCIEQAGKHRIEIEPASWGTSLWWSDRWHDLWHGPVDTGDEDTQPEGSTSVTQGGPQAQAITSEDSSEPASEVELLRAQQGELRWVLALIDHHTELTAEVPFSYADFGLASTLCFSPTDSRLLVIGTQGGAVLLWDMFGKRLLGGRPLQVSGEPVTALAFSGDGGMLAVGAGDGSVRLWDPVARTLRGAPLAGLGGAVMSLVFSTDGATLAGSADGGSVRIWDTALVYPRSDAITGAQDGMVALGFLSDGTLLAAGSRVDGLVRLWEPATTQDIGDPITRGGPVLPAFSRNGRQLVVSGPQGAQVWDTARRRQLAGMNGRFRTAVFSYDGTLMALSGDALSVWEMTGEEPKRIGSIVAGPTGPMAAALSADNSLVAMAVGRGVRLWMLAAVRLLDGMRLPRP